MGVFKSESAQHNRTVTEYQSEMERNILNLQTVLFRPLRSHQFSSEWFENWDMSAAQRAINTYIYISGWIFEKVIDSYKPSVPSTPPSQTFQSQALIKMATV